MPQTAASLGDQEQQLERHHVQEHQKTPRGFLEMLNGSAIGNLGNDPELKYSSNGAPFLRFNVATNGRVKNQSGQWEDKTEWVRATVFGQRAESLTNHLRKGTRVFVSGRLEAKPWTSSQGEIRAGLELIADTVEFMSQRNEDASQQSRRPAPEANDGGELEDLPF